MTTETILLLAALWLAANTVGMWATVAWTGVSHPRPWSFLWRFWLSCGACAIIWLVVLAWAAYDAIRSRS